MSVRTAAITLGLIGLLIAACGPTDEEADRSVDQPSTEPRSESGAGSATMIDQLLVGSLTDYCDSGLMVDDVVLAISTALEIPPTAIDVDPAPDDGCEINGAVDGVGGIVIRLYGDTLDSFERNYQSHLDLSQQAGLITVLAEQRDWGYFVVIDDAGDPATNDAAEFGLRGERLLIRGGIAVLKDGPEAAAQAELIGRELMAMILGTSPERADDAGQSADQAGESADQVTDPGPVPDEFVAVCEIDGGQAFPDSAGFLNYCLGPELLDHTALETATVSVTEQIGFTINLIFLPGADGIDRFNNAAVECFQQTEICPTRQLAIVSGGEVVSAPAIQAGAFARDQIIVSGDWSEQEAMALRDALLEEGSYRPVLFIG